MCGLFGMTLPRNYPTHLLDRGAALALLGELAEDRGRDAAGLAIRHTSPGSPERWTVDKVTGPYRRLNQQPGFRNRVRSAQTAIGHTRWATQGSLDVANASPARAGTLLCTHNGDVDIDSIPHAPTAATSSSGTDSAVLFAALATAHRGRVNTRRIVSILSSLHGRAALAWTDTAHTDSHGAGGRVWLARAGLSPLTVGVDVDGGLWWASNPAWLRRLSHLFDLPFASLRTVAEGTLLSATPQASTVKLTEHAQFKPTIRVLDQRLASTSVWRGFGSADQHHDQARPFHRIAKTSRSRPLPPYDPHPFDQHRFLARAAARP